MSFDWIAAASKAKEERRKALPYAALSALQRSDQSYATFKRECSGHVTESTWRFCCARDRETAITLFSLAVRAGFIDC